MTNDTKQKTKSPTKSDLRKALKALSDRAIVSDIAFSPENVMARTMLARFKRERR